MEYKEKQIIPNTNNRYYATIDGHIYDSYLNRFVDENKSKRGWLRCHIWMNEERKTIGVHRLIAYAYFGVSSLTVNHKDGNKENNSVFNLEYMTLQDQNIHRSKIIKKGNLKKVKCLENNKIYDSIKDACDDLGLNY